MIAVLTMGFYTAQSDRIGRKCLIFLTLVPIIWTYLLVIVMAQPSNHWSINWLYVNAVVVGCLGDGATLLQPAIAAYIGMCAPNDDIRQRMNNADRKSLCDMH